jgi:hypothetical protein
VPLDPLPVSGGGPETGDEDDQAEARDGAVRTRVILALLGDERTDEDHGDRASGAEWQAQVLGDHVDDALHDVLPYKGYGHHGVARRDVEGYEADHDEEPEKEGDEPAVVGAMEDKTCDPPSAIISLPSFSY